MRSAAASAAMVLALVTVGASAGPVEAQQVMASSADVQSVVREPGPPVRARGALPPPTALEVFQDTTLVRLIHEAVQGNPNLHAAQARIRAASAERVQSALDLAPTVTATGGFTRQRISGISFPGVGGTLPDQSLWSAGVQVSWEVDVFGRVRHSLEGRSSLLDAAEADVKDTRVLLGAEVASTYFRLRGAQDRLRVARENADNQRRTLRVTQDRLDGGRGTALDTERARAQLSTTLAAIPELEAAVSAEKERLSMLIGHEAQVVDADEGPQAAPPLPGELTLPDLDAAAETRPDVVAAQQRVAASGAFVGAAKASYLPRLSIQGAAGFTASSFDAVGNSGTGRYAVGPVLTWPLLDLGRVKSEVDAARAAQVEADAEYQGALLQARQEIRTSLVDYRTARQRLENLRDASDASRRAADLARLRFQEGAGDFLVVLDAERRLLEAEDQLSTGRTEATNALVAVYRATGARWTDGEGRGVGRAVVGGAGR